MGRSAIVALLLAAALVAPGCKPSGNASAPSTPAPAAAHSADDLNRAFAAAFGQAAPAVRIVNRDGSGETTVRYRPLGLVELNGRTALVSGGWTDSCHGCTGTLAIHYLQRTPQGFRVAGAWPEIVDGTSFGEPPQWKTRADLFPQTAIEASGGGTWQGCTVEYADLIELTADRPIVRVRHVLLDYDNSGAGQEDGAVHGGIKGREPGRSLEADYTGATRLGVVYIRSGDAYQPEHNEPDLPSC